MKRRKIPYQIGSLIAVKDEADAILAICRVEGADKKGIIIGRFFLKYSQDDAGNFQPQGDSFVWRFGDLDIMNDLWPVLGLDPSFVPDPTAKFYFLQKCMEPFQNRIDVYDSDANKIASFRPSEDATPDLPPAGLHGAGAVINVLKLIIAESRHPHD